jgi:membrane protein YqaA with SNARE-associated domain
MLRKMYDWCVATAGKPYAMWTMGTVSFAESSFFPIPPDAMLIPMSLARPDRAYHFATVCTIASVAGGVLGYAIGYFLYESLGLWLMQLYGYGARVEAFQEWYKEWGAWVILIKGLTPIPYKLVTITSGFAHYPIVAFIVLSIITRGMRFYAIAFLAHRYGDRARLMIEERLGLWTALAAAVLVVGIVGAVYLF